MADGEAGIRTLQLIPPANCKSNSAVRNAFDNNRVFTVVGGGKIRPSTLHNVNIELLYDGGRCTIKFFKP